MCNNTNTLNSMSLNSNNIPNNLWCRTTSQQASHHKAGSHLSSSFSRCSRWWPVWWHKGVVSRTSSRWLWCSQWWWWCRTWWSHMAQEVKSPLSSRSLHLLSPLKWPLLKPLIPRTTCSPTCSNRLQTLVARRLTISNYSSNLEDSRISVGLRCNNHLTAWCSWVDSRHLNSNNSNSRTIRLTCLTDDHVVNNLISNCEIPHLFLL